MYREGDSIGYLGLECLNSTSFDATESVWCGPDGVVVETDAVLACPTISRSIASGVARGNRERLSACRSRTCRAIALAPSPATTTRRRRRRRRTPFSARLAQRPTPPRHAPMENSASWRRVTATARRHSGLASVTLYPKCVPLNMFPSGKRCFRPALFCIPCVHPSTVPGRHFHSQSYYLHAHVSVDVTKLTTPTIVWLTPQELASLARASAARIR